jgi:GR25 family glycosyltransferase involved in LPS biosynthesis
MIIDKIYIINLKSRTDRIIYIEKLVNLLEIDKNKIKLFEAIVGDDLKKDKINNILSISSQNTLYNTPTNHKDIRTKGAIGCYLSHYKIWNEIIDNNYSNCIIFEDDIYSNINAIEFNKYINSIPNDYDIGLLSWFKLWFDPLDNPNKKTTINDYWYKYNSVNIFGGAGYLVSKKGAEKLIKDAFPICYQVDAYMNILNFLNKDFIRYIAKESILNQNIFLWTNIQSTCSECDVTEKINTLYNKKYNIETFGILDNNNNLILFIIFIIVILFIKNK